MNKTYEVSNDIQREAIEELSVRHDGDAERLKRLLALPDLSLSPESPLHEIVLRACKVESLKGFDVIKIPEIIPTNIMFGLFNMPPGHPARSRSDTYYVNDELVLRTHDTVFWYYYLNLPEVKKRIENKETLGVICYGKVYRKDEIDRSHMNVFHQFGGLYIGPDEKEKITPDDLKKTLSEIAESIFGKVNYRFYDHDFPYTDPSFEMEAEVSGRWIEMVGSGMARKSVLSNFGLEGYHGWAFGFGLERLAMASMDLPDIRLLWSTDPRVKSQLKLGQKYKEVSKFPPVIRDISFVVDASEFVLNDYFDSIRDILGDVAEQVELLDKYENKEKFGEGKVSYTFRITYRDLHKTLTNEEVNVMQKKVEEMTRRDYRGEIRLS